MAGGTTDRLLGNWILPCVLLAVVFAAWVAPGAKAQTLVGSVYEGKAGVGEPRADVRATFGTGGQLTWQIVGTWAYYDDEDEYLYHFPSITGTGTYTYDTGTHILTFDSDWSGDVQTIEDSLYHCTYARVRSSASDVSVSQDMSTITGEYLQSGDFYYEGYGPWEDTDIPGTLNLTRVSGPPTATPTRTPPPAVPTPTPTVTRTPAPAETPTPKPRPTAMHPEFDVNDDGWIDAEDLMLFMQDWHHWTGPTN